MHEWNDELDNERQQQDHEARNEEKYFASRGLHQCCVCGAWVPDVREHMRRAIGHYLKGVES
jgi:hypothetical protein